MPDVSTLISSVLPFSSADAGLENLVRCWSEAFQLERAALAWTIEFHQTAELALWSAPDSFTRSRSPRATQEDFHPGCLEGLLPQAAAMEWHRLEPGGWLGTVPALREAHSPEWETWLDVSGTLTETILAWETTLREHKLEALAEYAAGAGHEINNPLGTISGRAAQLLKGETDPQRRRSLETIGGQVYRIRDMIGDSMLFARPPAPQPEPVDLARFIPQTLNGFADEFASRQIDVDQQVPSLEEVVVLADPTQLAVVLSELIRNAIEAEAKRIVMECRPERSAGRGGGLVRIADDGIGLTETQREHCFDPFFSGRQAGRGLGFGLSKCWRIVREHQGVMELVGSAPPWTEFRAWLPSGSGSTTPGGSEEDKDSVPSSPG
jgi:signal transduction histidine kinase